MAEEEEGEVRTISIEELTITDLLSLYLPPEARKHAIRSQREFLLSIRSLMDSCLERLEEREERTENVRRIEIE